MHSDAARADDALKAYQQVDPKDDHEIETWPLDPDCEAVWGSIGAWDFVEAKLITWRRKWVWAKDVMAELPAVKEDEPIGRFLWLTLVTTEQGDSERFCKPLKKFILRGQIEPDKVVVSQ